MNNEQLKQHLTKVDKLVQYYMDNREDEEGTIREALEYLFCELSGSDMDRAMATLESKQVMRKTRGY
jgi:hypothetical protein